MKIGVFDSGIGGAALAEALQKTFPNAQLIVVNDHDNVPYGDKTNKEIIRLTDSAIQPLITANCDVIIIACNTATAVAIEMLRNSYHTQKFIGIEPMIKAAAAHTKNNVIAVCATPTTLTSARYQKLVEKHGSHLTILEPDCSEWAYMIENNTINKQHIATVINTLCDRGADVIVLGCTHYHWIKDLVKEIVNGRAEILEPSEAIGRRVKQLLNI